MGFDDRAGSLLFGCLIGFVLGYTVRALRESKEEMIDDVDDAKKLVRNEQGFIQNSILMDLTLFVVVILTVWAAFASQKASNGIRETQIDLSRITFCNQQYLSKTIDALNERTTYSQNQANSNVELQKAQAIFLRVVLEKPPASHARGEAALNAYFDALTEFVAAGEQSDRKVENNPYPTNEELSNCLNQS